MTYASFIAENLKFVHHCIEQAADRVVRDPKDITLVAVSKTFSPEAMLAAYHAGQRHFGENRPEEGAEKIPEVLASIDNTQPTWHMIGHIQRRKAKHVIEFFDIVHSIDRMAIATRLSNLAQQADREIPVFLECKISGETSKYGFDVTGWDNNPPVFERFCNEVKTIMELPFLKISGLMTIPPFVENPEATRPVFASLRNLRETLNKKFPSVTLKHLSMGMSHDFEVAIEEGATIIRIGRKIFGQRPT